MLPVDGKPRTPLSQPVEVEVLRVDSVDPQRADSGDMEVSFRIPIDQPMPVEGSRYGTFLIPWTAAPLLHERIRAHKRYPLGRGERIHWFDKMHDETYHPLERP